jgi:hypothetical protein
VGETIAQANKKIPNNFAYHLNMIISSPLDCRNFRQIAGFPYILADLPNFPSPSAIPEKREKIVLLTWSGNFLTK